MTNTIIFLKTLQHYSPYIHSYLQIPRKFST